MKSFPCQIFVLLIFSFISRAFGQNRPIYSPDRDFFFAKCAAIRDFGQAVPKGSVHEARPVEVTPEMKATILGFFDYWQTKGDWDKRKLAYILATAFRETRGSFLPVRESPSFGDDEVKRAAYIGRELERRAREANRKPPPNYALPARNGKRYYGRGYVQLTSPGNYLTTGKKLGLNTKLYDDPDLVLEPGIALEILVNGMMEGGYFRAAKLSDYFNDQKADWLNARDTVNPKTPHKATMEAIARGINDCLK